MELSKILSRQIPPKPWAEGEKIPWNEPEFSKRMLKEHLSQDHDAASRRFEIIDRHVDWIHNDVLNGKPARILDLGCGPGFYTSRLARLGHTCVGIDFSPASIEYAAEQAAAEELTCTYHHADIRTAEFGRGFDLVMSIYGELNVFRKTEAAHILAKAHQALNLEGKLVLEPHSFDKVLRYGQEESTWYASQGGLFSEAPHLGLQESFWDEEEKVAIYRIYIIDTDSGTVTCHSSSTQAYTIEEYQSLLEGQGFGEIQIFPALGETGDQPLADLIAIVAEKK